MKKVMIGRAVSVLLCCSMILSLFPTAFAANSNENSISNLPDTYLEEIVDGYVFVQQSDNKQVAIATNNTDHVIAASIKYLSSPDVVYQWIINDYPVATFGSTDLSFWADVIEYAEENMNEASLITFSFVEVNENDPMVISSAGADLAADLSNLTGNEYSNKDVKMVREMDGHRYQVFETLEFDIRKVGTVTWKDGITVSSLIVGVLGLVATSTVIGTVCGILGIAATVATTVLPEGKMNQYSCMALYTRYVIIDNGTRQYAHAYKIRVYDGYEDASNNSSGRAHIIRATGDLFFDPDPTGEFFEGGLLDEAYKDFYNIW